MTEKTIVALAAVERDFVQIEAALDELLASLNRLPVRQASGAAGELRRTRDLLHKAYERLAAPLDEAAALLPFLDPAPF